MPELRTARENARLEIGSQRGRNSHRINFLGIYDLQGLSYGGTELLVADMRLLAPDPSSSVFGSYVYVRVCTCSFWPIWLGGMPSEAKGAAVRKKPFLRGLSQLHRCPWVGRWWLSIPAALERLLVPKRRRMASRALTKELSSCSLR